MSIDCIDCSCLPEDLLIKILLCQPITTLLRLKSVCKSWMALINSSHFIHLHATTADDNTFIFLSRHVFLNTYKKKREFSWNTFSISGGIGAHEVYEDLGMPPCYRNVFLNTYKKKREFSWNTFSISGGIGAHEVYEDLGMPPCYRKPMYSLRMVGSCNGVICLHDNELRDVILWNPAIQQFRRLRKSLTIAAGIGDVVRDFVAFGFDVETKDYKVVLITSFFSRNQSGFRRHTYHRVQMYNLSTDSWRTLEDVALPFEPVASNHGGYLNGSYYCLGSKETNTSISEVNWKYPVPWIMYQVLSFDFTKEIFKTIQLPDGINYIGIILLGEKIVLVDHFQRFETHNLTRVFTYDFWVLNIEIGGNESWTKLYTIGPYGMDEKIPIGISNNGEFIFMVTSKGESLWLLNRSTQVRKELQCDGNQIMTSCTYRRSLVPVCGIRNGSTMLCSLFG